MLSQPAAMAVVDEAEDVTTWHQDVEPEPHERVGDCRARFMFSVATAFLLILGLLLSHNISDRANTAVVSPWLAWPLFFLWIIIVLDGLYGVALARDDLKAVFKRFLLVTLVPPFRVAIAPAYPNRFVWVPKHGWLEVNRLNVERVELRLALPMLAITLLVLPTFAVEVFFSDLLQRQIWLAVTMHALAAFIWFAFALEFLVMFSLAERKLVYCKLHWVNIAIIILPLIAVLRTLQLIRFMRMARAAKLIRAYRLRGIVARGMRLALVFNLIDRFLERNPEKYLQVLEEKMAEKEAELRSLREKAAEVRKKVEKHAAESDAVEAASQIPETRLGYSRPGDSSALS